MPDVQSTLHTFEKAKRKAKTLKKRKMKNSEVYREHPQQKPRLETRNEAENNHRERAFGSNRSEANFQQVGSTLVTGWKHARNRSEANRPTDPSEGGI